MLVEQLVQQVLVEPGGVEGVPSAAVGQRQPGGDPDVVGGHRVPALPRGVRGGGPGGDDVGPQPVHLERGADAGDGQPLLIGQPYVVQPVAGGGDPASERRLGVRVLAGEGDRVAVEVHPPADHLGAQGRVAGGGDLDRQPEPVQQLGAELALLRVHRADQHDPRGVADRDPLALDGGAARGRGVQQQVDQMVVQQVDLVDVEDPAVGRGQQPGLVASPCRCPAPAAGRAPRSPGPRFAPTGSSTSRAGRVLAPSCRATSGHPGSGSAGSQLNRQPATTGTSGSTWARARTMVVLAVPFSPRTSTPPISGATVVRISAVARSSDPTIAENGNARASLISGHLHPSCGCPRPRQLWVDQRGPTS